jgi:hypothetical protein
VVSGRVSVLLSGNYGGEGPDGYAIHLSTANVRITSRLRKESIAILLIGMAL